MIEVNASVRPLNGNEQRTCRQDAIGRSAGADETLGLGGNDPPFGRAWRDFIAASHGQEQFRHA